MEILFWIAVLTWMVKRSAEDVLHAVKGTPNPRYELKKAKAEAAGQQPGRQPRYGGKEWFADLLSDALAANTEKRRKKAAVKARPIDDLADAVRERHPHDPNNTRNCPTCKGEVVLDGRPCPSCLAEQQRRNAEWEEGMQPIGDYEKPTCVRCRATYAQPGSANCPACDRAEGNYPDDRPIAPVINLFPNPKHVEKEITMSNEANGLSTAIAFADAASKAHESFATTGAEGYVGALERGGMGGEPVGTAREAMEASGIAADKWAAHKATLEAQLNLKEAYQSQPDAADKEYLLAE